MINNDINMLFPTKILIQVDKNFVLEVNFVKNTKKIKEELK